MFQVAEYRRHIAALENRMVSGQPISVGGDPGTVMVFDDSSYLYVTSRSLTSLQRSTYCTIPESS